jgi:hypothetical protein
MTTCVEYRARPYRAFECATSGSVIPSLVGPKSTGSREDEGGNGVGHQGQIQGGIAQGAGQALIEDIVYDRDSGQLLTGTLMDYGILRAPTWCRRSVSISAPSQYHEPARRQGCRRRRHGRQHTDGNERDPRRPRPGRRHRPADAGHPGARLARRSRASAGLTQPHQTSVQLTGCRRWPRGQRRRRGLRPVWGANAIVDG